MDTAPGTLPGPQTADKAPENGGHLVLRVELFALGALAFSLATGLGGCQPIDGSNPPGVSAASTACTTRQAQIEIGDGYQRILCGCAEPSGTVIAAGQSAPALTCTVPIGTVVFFEFLSTRALHQILSDGTPEFPSSPVSDPNGSPFIPDYGATFSTAGTYLYSDAFDPGTTGQIVAK